MQENPLDLSRARALSWAALLGQWMAFARSAAAIPDGPGLAWKHCVSDLIGLQAVTAALNDWDHLVPRDQALAVDRSALAIEKHLENITRHLGPPPWTAGLEELVREARGALKEARRKLETPSRLESL